jgi:hypothetical protein
LPRLANLLCTLEMGFSLRRDIAQKEPLRTKSEAAFSDSYMSMVQSTISTI